MTRKKVTKLAEDSTAEITSSIPPDRSALDQSNKDIHEKVKKTTIITDPIHQVMNFGSNSRFHDCLMGVLDTREFQRLRGISQVGLTSYVFPGATHTRFSHCLGVAYLAYSVLTHLREWADEVPDNEDIDNNFDAVVMSALLHDVGHGPFSHSFEEALKDEGFPNHEAWTSTIITHEKSEIGAVLSKHGVNVGKVASAIDKKLTEGLPRYLRQIVSSQVDVDRMDYLVRDSHFAGVAIGKFDVHYLINSMVIIRHGRDRIRTLGMNPKGVKAYEAFLLARQLMNRTVYFHHNVKSLEFMMEHLIRLVIKNLRDLDEIPGVKPFIPQYFRDVAAFGGKLPEADRARFMLNSYDSYVRLTEDAIWMLVGAIADSDSMPVLRVLANRILRRDIFSDFEVEEGKAGLLNEMLRGAGFEEGVDFNIRHLNTTVYKGSDDPVFVLGWDGEIDEISTQSDVISALKDKPEREWRLIVLDDDKKSDIKNLCESSRLIKARQKDSSKDLG